MPVKIKLCCTVEQLCPLHRGVLKCIVFGCFSAQLYSTMFSLIESFHERIADIRERETQHHQQQQKSCSTVDGRCLGLHSLVNCEVSTLESAPESRLLDVESTEELPFLIRRHS